MLGKIIKYDFRYLNKMLLLIHAFLLMYTLAARFILSPIAEKTNISDSILMLVILMYVIILLATSFGTYIFIAVRFYKNLFSDEGYISRTIPVKSSTHLLAKTISGFIWAFLDTIILLATVFLLFSSSVFTSGSGDISEFLKYWGIGGVQITIFVLTLIIGTLSNVVMIYIAIALGQTFASHKVISSVAMYFVVSMAISIISMAVALPNVFSSFTEAIIEVTAISNLLGWTSLSSAVLTIVMYAISNYILNKKVDL
ncbi:MAG: hypothetical protein ACK5LL_12870 [Suipraeoptans sp.]